MKRLLACECMNFWHTHSLSKGCWAIFTPPLLFLRSRFSSTTPEIAGLKKHFLLGTSPSILRKRFSYAALVLHLVFFVSFFLVFNKFESFCGDFGAKIQTLHRISGWVTLSGFLHQKVMIISEKLSNNLKCIFGIWAWKRMIRKKNRDLNVNIFTYNH